ncbi:MAG TPA: TIGR03620 family F420-dependent LLM class oxidoreductase [Pseudonocardiaceae bacterium]|jgi:probable F420-dependent oxidoreductase
MSRVEVGRIGVALNVSADDTYLEEAAEAERLGYSTIWLPGGQIDGLDRIAKLVRATTTIPVASAIISADVFTPDAVRDLYADLQATAPDRFVAGLGGPQQPRSMRALNDYLDELDAGEPPVPAERRILAALGPRKLELARDRCAGAITLLVTPAYTSMARQVLGTDSTLIVDQMCVLDTDAAHARETARGSLRFLSGVGGYIANFERMGFSDADISELSDRLVDDLVAWGDADAIVTRVTEHLDAGADQVVLGVLNKGGQPAPIEVARRLAHRLLG